jgi:hypothetical protein
LAEKSLTLSELEYSTEYDSRVHGWRKANPDYAHEEPVAKVYTKQIPR